MYGVALNHASNTEGFLFLNFKSVSRANIANTVNMNALLLASPKICKVLETNCYVFFTSAVNGGNLASLSDRLSSRYEAGGAPEMFASGVAKKIPPLSRIKHLISRHS